MIGSSNITRYALLKNIEWDVAVQDDDVYKQAMSEFEDKWKATHLLNPEICRLCSFYWSAICCKIKRYAIFKGERLF